MEILDRRIGVEKSLMSTTHAYTSTQAVKGLTKDFDGIAVRVPLPCGSMADIVAVTSRDTSAEEVNSIFSEEAKSDRYEGILGVSADPLVSADIIADSRGSIVDQAMTRVVGGNLVKVMSWYDNEWGYASQMVRHALARAGHDVKQAPSAQLSGAR